MSKKSKTKNIRINKSIETNLLQELDQKTNRIEKPASKEIFISTREEFNDLKKSLGTENQEMTLHLISQLVKVMPNSDQKSGNDLLTLATALQRSIQPKDEFEALLASQMVAVHNLAMKFLAASNYENQTTAGVTINIERANKLLRTFTAQIEALNRHRGKGQQKVTVEHVTVNQGGQAMIGTVEQPKRRGEGGAMNKSDNLPHDAPSICGAMNRKGYDCNAFAMKNGRCRFHGGKSTGPRTLEGKERARKANWKHGLYSQEAKQERFEAQRLIRAFKELKCN